MVAVSIFLFRVLFLLLLAFPFRKFGDEGFLLFYLIFTFFFSLLAVLGDLGCKSTERIPSLRRWALNFFGPSCQRYPGLGTSLFRGEKKKKKKSW